MMEKQKYSMKEIVGSQEKEEHLKDELQEERDNIRANEASTRLEILKKRIEPLHLEKNILYLLSNIGSRRSDDVANRQECPVNVFSRLWETPMTLAELIVHLEYSPYLICEVLEKMIDHGFVVITGIDKCPYLGKETPWFTTNFIRFETGVTRLIKVEYHSDDLPF